MRSAVLLASLALAAAPARAAPDCRGTLSGAAKGAFGCVAVLASDDEGKVFFVLQAKDAVQGVPSYAPGAFELPGAPAVRTYRLADLGAGKASVLVDAGTMYSATKTTGTRGEVTLTLKSVKRDPKKKSAWVAHGTYRARLLPAGSPREDEVVVEATF
jgi:hypothetical protein